MLNKIGKILNQTFWFVQSGIAPKNTSIELKEHMENLNHMTSKKFSMTMVAVAIIAFMYFASVIFLFFFTEEPRTTALVSMYKDMIVAIASIVATLVGIQGLVDWKYGSKSDVELISETQKITEEMTIIDEGRSRPDFML